MVLLQAQAWLALKILRSILCGLWNFNSEMVCRKSSAITCFILLKHLSFLLNLKRPEGVQCPEKNSFSQWDKRRDFAFSTCGHEGHAEESISTPASVIRMSSSSLTPRPTNAGSTYVNHKCVFSPSKLSTSRTPPSPWMQAHSSQAQE